MFQKSRKMPRFRDSEFSRIRSRRCYRLNFFNFLTS
nr:MAG TPA: hypothetical protein [Bacteriophage sp.]